LVDYPDDPDSEEEEEEEEEEDHENENGDAMTESAAKRPRLMS